MCLRATAIPSITASNSRSGISIFGTYYLPQENGQRLQPYRIGHPSGIPDEANYLKILLEPFGLYRPLARRSGSLKEPDARSTPRHSSFGGNCC